MSTARESSHILSKILAGDRRFNNYRNDFPDNTSIYQFGIQSIFSEKSIGSKAKSLHNARAEGVDEYIRMCNQLPQELHSSPDLDVHRN